MQSSKRWWESKTIWTQIIGLLFMALVYFDQLPADLDQEAVITAIMGVVGVLTIIFRAKATTEIAPK